MAKMNVPTIDEILNTPPTIEEFTWFSLPVTQVVMTHAGLGWMKTTKKDCGFDLWEVKPIKQTKLAQTTVSKAQLNKLRENERAERAEMLAKLVNLNVGEDENPLAMAWAQMPKPKYL